MSGESDNPYAPSKLSSSVLIEEDGPLGSVPLPWAGTAMRAAAPVWAFVSLIVPFSSNSEPSLEGVYTTISVVEAALLAAMAIGFWRLHRLGRIAATVNVVMTIGFPLGIEVFARGGLPPTYRWDDYVFYGLLVAGGLLLWRPTVTQLFEQKQSGTVFRRRRHSAWPRICGAGLALLTSAMFVTTPEFTAAALHEWAARKVHPAMRTWPHQRSDAER